MNQESSLILQSIQDFMSFLTNVWFRINLANLAPYAIYTRTNHLGDFVSIHSRKRSHFGLFSPYTSRATQQKNAPGMPVLGRF